MKKMIAVLMFVLCATACIQDGAPLPRTDDAPDAMPPTEPDAPPPDAPPPVDCPPDAQPPAPTLNFTATPSTITSGQSSTLSWSTTNATSCSASGGWSGTKPANGNYPVSPTVTKSYGLTCSGLGGSVTRWVTVTVTAAALCHGLIAKFTAADLANIAYCTGWSANGTGTPLTPALEVVGGDGVCAITCNKKVTYVTTLPCVCSGIWLAGGTADVPRWSTAGCKRLPDHPANEANQAGCAWDKRCDLL